MTMATDKRAIAAAAVARIRGAYETDSHRLSGSHRQCGGT
jgi:hypothetical protein